MTSQTLREARKYEEASEKMIKQEERPDFHLSVRTGWMNDPNGFSYYNGQYHLFYQYNPYAPRWDSMHWGHAVTKDFLHWDYLPAALAPDEAYDRDGCFSGSALTLPDGRQLLMYTGVLRERKENGEHCDTQTQCLAVGDGVDYEKCAGNPVLDKNRISGIRKSGGRKTAFMRLSAAGAKIPAGRSFCTPARTDSSGSLKACSPRTITGSERCGNARISSGWTANGSF